MNGFISHIINRHLHTENNIMPRVPGRFESFNPGNQSQDEINALQPEEVETNSNQAMEDGNAASPQKRSTNQGEWNSPLTDSTFNTKGQDKPPFPIPDESIKDRNTAPQFLENRVGKDNNDTLIITKADKVISANNILPKQVESSIAPDDRNTSSNIVSPFIIQDNARHFIEKKNEHNESTKLPLQTSIVPQTGKDTFVNSRSLFVENMQQKTPSVIKVSIGRIDVRAIVASASEKKEQSTSQKPNMTLDDYLKKRNSDK